MVIMDLFEHLAFKALREEEELKDICTHFWWSGAVMQNSLRHI